MKSKCYLVLKKVARDQLAALNSNFLSTKDQMLVCKRDEVIRSQGEELRGRAGINISMGKKLPSQIQVPLPKVRSHLQEVWLFLKKISLENSSSWKMTGQNIQTQRNQKTDNQTNRCRNTQKVAQ